MRCAWLWVLAAVVAGCASPGGARGASSHLQGRLPELDYFVGQWRAQLQDPRTGQRRELLYAVQPQVGGVWYQGSGRVPAEGLEILDLWGRDPQTRELVRSVFDSSGTYGTVRSKGWDGDRLVLEGQASSPQGVFRVRETITRVGPDEFHATWEARLDGAWTAYSVEQLRRVR